MTYQSWLRQAVARLSASDSPKRDAEILLSFVTGKNRTFLLAFAETALSADELAAAEDLLQRRALGEPIAYLTGIREFWSLPLQVSPATLIPRPDTERLVELALERLSDRPAEVLDLGTGTGAIALAIASEKPQCRVTGVDVRQDAVELANVNRLKLNINNVNFLHSDWFSALKGRRFDIIVSNPPYIDPADPHLNQGDVRFEPKSALAADNQGLADIMLIADQSRNYLNDGGWLIIEHGWQQGEAVRKIFNNYSFRSIITEKDYGGNERVTLGYL
jgi:release factor glutamine methyltransferase